MNWEKAVNTIAPHVVKIETPTGYGTGFLVFYNYNLEWCGVATAAHVVSHADEWQEPIKIRNSSGMIFLSIDKRVIFLDYSTDSAVVLFFKGDLKLPEPPITLLPEGTPCSVGTDIGWVGYPVIEPNTLCFFAGTVSARQEPNKSYLIDGVAINGVSGGPIFHCPLSHPDGVQIIGAVSAYHANRATGEALPGLLRALDVSHFHLIAADLKTVDEANAAKRQLEVAQKQKPDDITEIPEEDGQS